MSHLKCRTTHNFVRSFPEFLDSLFFGGHSTTYIIVTDFFCFMTKITCEWGFCCEDDLTDFPISSASYKSKVPSKFYEASLRLSQNHDG